MNLHQEFAVQWLRGERHLRRAASLIFTMFHSGALIGMLLAFALSARDEYSRCEIIGPASVRIVVEERTISRARRACTGNLSM